AQWANIFREMHRYYPNAQVGFGEVAPQCHYDPDNHDCIPQEIEDICDGDDGSFRGCRCCVDAQPIYIKRYYEEWEEKIRKNLRDSGLERIYVGGYFYWYFYNDVVDQKRPNTIKALRDSFARFFP